MCIGRSLDPVTGYVLVLYSTVKLAMFAFLSCMTGFHKGLLMGDATFCIMKEKEIGRVQLKQHIPGETNPADLFTFTKILTRQPFEKHRKFVLNLPGDTGVEYARRQRHWEAGASSQRDGKVAV